MFTKREQITACVQLHESRGWMATVKVNGPPVHGVAAAECFPARVRGVTRGFRAYICQSQLRLCECAAPTGQGTGRSRLRLRSIP
jgi:hypothetical protein